MKLRADPNRGGSRCPDSHTGPKTSRAAREQAWFDQTWREALAPANDETGDVVVLGGSSDKFVEILHNVRQREGRSLTACGFQQGQQARFAKFRLFLVSGFGDAVGVDNQEIRVFEPRDACLVVFQDLDTEGYIVGFQPLNRSILACEDRRVVPGAEVGEISCGRVQFGKEGGRETPILTVRTDLPVQASHKLRERAPGTRQRSPAALH